MSTYTIRYNRTTDHIDGLRIRTAGSQMTYSTNVCGALSKGITKMATGKTSDDVATILRSAGITRKVCKSCEAAAKAMIADQADKN